MPSNSSLAAAWVLPLAACLALAPAFPGRASAGEISGKVTVLPPGGPAAEAAENAVVFIEELSQGAAAEAWERAKARLEQQPKMASKGKAFVPEVLPVLQGAKVSFPNEDSILHNVFSLSKVNSFDLGLYPKGPGKQVQFTGSGLVKVYCNIHEAMVGHVLVLENPFFTRTGADGSFRLSGVPNGRHRLVAWHRYGKGPLAQEVILGDSREVNVKAAASTATVSFQLEQGSLSGKHRNKWGKSYKEKY